VTKGNREFSAFSLEELYDYDYLCDLDRFPYDMYPSNYSKGV